MTLGGGRRSRWGAGLLVVLVACLCHGAGAEPEATPAPFPRAVSPFPIAPDTDVARVTYRPNAEQTWLLQQRVFVYRQDVEIRTQQHLTTRAAREPRGRWRFEGRGTVLAADGFVDGYGKTLPTAELANDMTLAYVTDGEGAILELDVEGGGAQVDVAQRALRAVQTPRNIPDRLKPGQGWTHTEHLDLDLGAPADGGDRGLAGMRLVADVHAAFVFDGWSVVGPVRTLRLDSTVRLDGVCIATFDDGHVFTQAMALDVSGYAHIDERSNIAYQVVDLRLVMTDDRDVNARIHVKQVLADEALAGQPGVCEEGYLLNEDGSCGRWRTPYRTRVARRGEDARVLSDRFVAVFGGLTPVQMDAYHEALAPFHERFGAATTEQEREAVVAELPELPAQLGVELVDLDTGEVAPLRLPRSTHHYDLFAVDEARFAVVGSITGPATPTRPYVAAYDLEAGAWTSWPDVPSDSGGCIGTTLDDGRPHLVCSQDDAHVGWTLEDQQWREGPADERLLTLDRGGEDWVPEGAHWRLRHAAALTAGSSRWLLARQDDETTGVLSVLSAPECGEPRRGIDQVVLADGVMTPLDDLCAAREHAPASPGLPDLVGVPAPLGELPMEPLELDQGVLFVGPHPLTEHGLQWWPRGAEDLHAVVVADEPMPTDAEEELRLGAVGSSLARPQHVVLLAALPLDGSALIVTETEYDGWDYTRYNDSVTWEFDPATATLRYRSYLDVGLDAPEQGPRGQWIALQEFDDDLAAHFAWADSLKRWIRLPNTTQRGAAHYESRPLDPIRTSDGAVWPSWMAKPSRQWQAPFFTWEVLERRGFCLSGATEACEPAAP